MSDRLFSREYRIPPEHLALYRIAFALTYFFLLGVPCFRWIAEIPGFYFAPQPLSIARLFATDVPGVGWLILLDASILLTLLGVLLGYRTVLSSLLLCILLFVGYSLKFSLGKIGHSFLSVIIPGLLAFSGWGDRYSLDARRRAATPERPYAAFSLFLLALVTGFALFSAGFGKLWYGWADPEKYGVYRYIVERFYLMEPQTLLGKALIHAPLPLWKLTDYATVVFEMGFLVAVWRRTWFRCFCWLAVGFHLVTYLLLDIAFLNNYLVYLLFMDWRPVRAFVAPRWERWGPVLPWVLVTFLLLQYGWFYAVSSVNLQREQLISPLLALTTDEWDLRDVRAALLIPGAVIVALWQARRFVGYRSSSR